MAKINGGKPKRKGSSSGGRKGKPGTSNVMSTGRKHGAKKLGE